MSIRPVFSVCLIAALSVACSSTPARGALAAHARALASIHST